MGMSDGSDPTPNLKPAENRGYRELYSTSRQLVNHWQSLASRLDASEAALVLEKGAGTVRGLLDELAETTPKYNLYGAPAAQGVGAALSGARKNLIDRALERNQALRLAVLDIQHLTTLLPYLAALADGREDEELAAFCRSWERKLKRVESAVRKAAVSAAADPDAAIEPYDDSRLGRFAHSAAEAIGTMGEWRDRRAGRTG
jgi:hypothetical protein